MKNDPELFLVFFILALSYTCFLLYTLFRLIQSRDFIQSWKYARLIYAFQFVQLLLRSVSFWLICIFADNIEDNQNLTFSTFTLPDSLLIASFIVLFWIMITCTRFTRIDSDCCTEAGTLLIRAGRITLIILICWLCLEFMLYGLLYLDLISKEAIGLQQCIICLLSSVIVMSGLVAVQVKFSGLPNKTEQDGKYLKTVLFVTIVWISARITHGVLYFIRNSSLNDTQSFSNLVSKTQTIVIIIIDLLATELMCYYFILDYSFFRIFKSNFIDEPINTKLLLNDGISMNLGPDTASPSDLDDVSVHSSEPLSSLKGKLGTLHVTGYNLSRVVIRHIKLPRVNKYVLENLKIDVESIKNLMISNLTCVTSCNLQETDVELIMPYFPNGSLHQAIHSDKRQFSVIKKVEISYKLAEIIAGIHMKNRFHGHLTSFNVLLNSEFDPLVSDLGLEHLRKFCGLVGGYCNKSAWSSPELLKDPAPVVTKATFMDDVYSYGIILWELFFESEPFPGYSQAKLKEMVVEQGYRPAVTAIEPKGIEELIKSCWNKDPSHRPDFSFIAKELSIVLRNLELDA